MKKVLFSVALALVAGFSFAQEKNVKEAKSIANEMNPDFAKAEQLINEALTNPETKDQAETWNVAGTIQRRKSEKEMEKAYLQKPYDKMLIYNAALDMCKYFQKCDELAQVPDAKGKIKNKYRKPNAATIKSERANLVNGGIEYYNQFIDVEKQGSDDKTLGKKALECFGMYIDVASAPMMASENLLQTDTLMGQVAYFACLTAVKVGDYASVAKYAPYGADDKEYGKFTMEFNSTALKELGKTDEWVASLKDGLQKYPDHQFFFGHLIDYYSNNNKYDEAMQFADEMLAKDPKNTFYLYVKGYLCQSQYADLKSKQKEAEATATLDKAIEFYKQTIEIDANYAEAYSNLGLIYCVKAQDFSEKAASDINDPNYAKDQETLKGFYKEAQPYYEKARALKPDNKDLWMQGLYRVYYNLNMGDEFKEIESLMGL